MTTLRINIDPTGHHVALGAKRIPMIEACGIVTTWVLDSPDLMEPLKQVLEAAYGFGPLWESKKASVTGEGVMQYPGDPDMYPLIRMERQDEVFYMYESAMIAIVNKDSGESFVSRMD